MRPHIPRRVGFAIALYFGGCSVAHAQRVGELSVRIEPAPWRIPVVLASCETGAVLVSSTNGMFASTDGVRWQRDGLEEDAHILHTHCIDGVAWGVGRPGIIARRDAGARRWVVEHRVPDREWWNRRADLFILEREPAEHRFRAYGLDGAGEPLELIREAPGAWSEVRAPARRGGWPPAVGDPAECRARPLRAQRSRAARIERAILCRGGRVLLFADLSARSHSVIRLPPRLRRLEWRDISVHEDSVFLFSAIRGDEIADEITRHAIARYRAGRWEMVTVEDPRVWPAVLRVGRAPFLIGTGHIYRFEEPR